MAWQQHRPSGHWLGSYGWVNFHSFIHLIVLVIICQYISKVQQLEHYEEKGDSLTIHFISSYFRKSAEDSCHFCCITVQIVRSIIFNEEKITL